uniref:Uncharacterized protein n=1 Tax=Corvus moneduloides TaxID=1196302 RepID=A0A8C3EQ97_CORMO
MEGAEAGMAGAGRCLRREWRQEDGGRVLSRSLSGQSYWLDLWLFILFDLALFLLIYLLP